MIRLFLFLLILLSSCSLNNNKNLSKNVDFDNFYNLSIIEYKEKLENYNKSKNYPDIDNEKSIQCCNNRFRSDWFLSL